MENIFLVALIVGLGLIQMLFASKVFKLFDGYESRQSAAERWINTVREDTTKQLDELHKKLRMAQINLEKIQLDDFKIVLEQIDVIKKRLPPEPDKKLLKRGTAKKRRA